VYWFVYLRRGMTVQLPGLFELTFHEPEKK
jgi:hypothetical protein